MMKNNILKLWLFFILLPQNLSSNVIPPLTIPQAISDAARAFKIDYRTLYAMCRVESGLNPKKVHYHDGGSSSYGLCQLKLATAFQMGFSHNPTLLLNPEINAFYAAKYFSKQLEKYHDVRKALRVYNTGHLDSELNSNYTKKVLALKETL